MPTRLWFWKKVAGFHQDAGEETVHAGLWSSVMAWVHRAQNVRSEEVERELDFSETETERIIRWLDNARDTASPFFKKGAQGGVYLCDAVSPPVIVKAPARFGARRWMDVIFLKREFRAYRRLRGVPGIPRCHGLLRGKYLVLERVEGVSRHEAVLEGGARERFFRELYELISELHYRGVAHGDLQNKNNLLVVDGEHPCLLDFGAAEVWRGGLAPVNHALFRFLCRLDFNTWVKLKYSGRVELASAEDRVFYRRTWIEKAARRAKVLLKRKGKR